jgi:endonuclease G, mitochondrial
MRAAAKVLVALAALAGATALATGAPAPSPGDIGFEHCASHYDPVGLPAMKEDASDADPVELCRQGYAALFNPDTHAPDWVMERLPSAQINGNAVRKNNFKKDPQVATSATPADYTGQGYDRGHQAPAGDFKSSQPMTDFSFLMTNMSPQVGVGFNRNIWKDLETDVRSWVACGAIPELYVVTGPVYGDTVTWMGKDKDHRVRIPDAFFKVIYDPTNDRALGMLLPNQKLNSADLPNYAVPISEIEEKTGITFFPKLSKREQNILKSSAGTLWAADDSCNADTGD